MDFLRILFVCFFFFPSVSTLAIEHCFYNRDGHEVYHNDLPVCRCFAHCKCLSEFFFNDVCQENRPNAIDRAWHEFISNIARAREEGPFLYHLRSSSGFSLDSMEYMIEDRNYVHSVSDYLTILKKCKDRMEESRLADIKGAPYYVSKKEEDIKDRIASVEARYAKAMQILDEIPNKIFPLYLEAIENCPHQTRFASYNKSLIYALTGHWNTCLEERKRYIDLSNEHNDRKMRSNEYQSYGEACLEVNSFDDAIDALTKAIMVNPNNQQAYFYRASAYYEIGQFDLALDDYLKSNRESEIDGSAFYSPMRWSSPVFICPGNEPSKTAIAPNFNIWNANKSATQEFTQALLMNLCKGVSEATVDFVPSLCKTTYGLGTTLWAVAKDPIESSKLFADACCEMSDVIVEYCKTLDADTLDTCVDQIKMLYNNYSQLSDAEKGALIGYTIGKYGVDIFVPVGCLKGVAAYHKLRNANRICQFESMALSTANKEAIVASSLQHAAEREAFFKNVRIEIDKQNKHIPGKYNYDQRKSVFEYPDAEELLRKYGGKGTRCRGNLGEPGYQEIINFERCIGYNICEKTGEKIATTWGKIHYSKNGAHIVPTRSRK